MEISGVMLALLRFEMDGTKLCENVKNLITTESLPALFKLSKKHDLAHLVGDALDKNGLLPDGSEEKKRFIQERNMAIYRCEQIQYELEQIYDVLEKAKISFIPLKGSVIRKYYPEPWMRTSCDIDVLVKESDLEDAIVALKTNLDYEDGARGEHDVNLFAPSGVHLELHFSLVETDNCWKNILEGVWDQRVKGWDYQFQMSAEIFYCYHLVHMAVHMRAGGCGVKPFLDTQIIHRYITLDRSKLDIILRQGELFEFEKAVLKLSNVWFLNAQSDAISEEFERFIFHGGVYGSLDNRVAVQQVKNGGKTAYLFSRIFIGYKELAIKYPSLKKHKWLFPFYQVYRWFDLFAHKESRKYTKATIKQTQLTTVEKLEETEKLFQEIGL